MVFLAMLWRGLHVVVFVVASMVKYVEALGSFDCSGGSIYFSAHPVDSLLFQSPDIFHDLYVFKCVTSVVFTTGDRGVAGNFSRSLEAGLETAYSYMAGLGRNQTSWNETSLEINKKTILLRFMRNAPQIQIMYLGLPSSKQDGQGYDSNNRATLKKLYQGEIKTINTTDGKSMYSLDDLKAVISAVLKQRAATDIRILDDKAPIPKNGQTACDHADHSISARIVSDVVRGDKIEGNVLAYAGSFMRKLDPNLNDTHSDLKAKSNAFFRYAPFDMHMCKDYQSCFSRGKSTGHHYHDDDVTHVAKWLTREYYVQSAGTQLHPLA
ncbi:hypothetical protein EJ04DRAFT_326658 [Polyplosphaeria fusca]|uniref:GlcNAc-PI de-N-acetylase n=1 Tax=Polyplosphaeria fusca TaxID=682080 RepID=A0A9P4RA36_9PLEO|nr:hypothetical protein EJ04DRAFT_326658 [Polyplosphaeria fusca]